MVKVLFFHIPKTGGTTFRMVLREFFPDSFHRCKTPNFEQVLKELKQFQCVEFHVAQSGNEQFYSHKDLIRKENWIHLKGKTPFIMFRDPVNRVVSAYFEHLRRAGHTVHTNLSLERFIKIKGVHNVQTGFVLGIHPRSGKLPGKEELKRAKEALIELNFNLGILERYAESLQLLQSATGKALNETIRIENATDKSLLNVVDEAARQMIHEKNSLDQQLYDFALQIFKRQLSGLKSTKTDYDFVP